MCWYYDDDEMSRLSFDEHSHPTPDVASFRRVLSGRDTLQEMAPTTVAEVVGLYLYPVKACQPVSLQKTKLDSAGFQLDRAFCIVDINGDRYVEKQALSQRLLPSLASIKVEFEDVTKKNVLVLSAPNMGKKLRVYTAEKKYEKNPQVLVECSGRSTTSNGVGAWVCCQAGTVATRLQGGCRFT